MKALRLERIVHNQALTIQYYKLIQENSKAKNSEKFTARYSHVIERHIEKSYTQLFSQENLF